MTPENLARQLIDKLLLHSGWIVQDVKTLNFSANLGIAVREYPTDSGPADYVLFIDRKPVGVIEAKPEGTILTPVEEQSSRYATSKLKWQKHHTSLRFIYESTGTETHFTDTTDPSPRSREVFSFHRPETLRDWLKQRSDGSEETLRSRLQKFPPLDTRNLRECQITAVTNLEKSFGKDQPRALVQMATGSGKTFTAITAAYRLLKHARANRILFLVDTKNLGEQSEEEFRKFKPNDDPRTFTELYNVQRLQSSFIAASAQVCISTIQRMYSMLRGEEMDESAEESSLNEVQVTGRSREVVYNDRIPPETFDFIIIDECHRSIYNEWKQVLDYFDAYLIGLTATPDNRTFGFFNRNVVSEYTYERAVADGVNVPFDVYTIETQITKQGAIVNAGEWVDKRERQTRRKRWEQLDEEVTYTGTALDRDVVNPDQIRTVIKTFQEKLPELFPNRKEVPKTLIFAKSDFHADDVIRTVREVFGEGNDFCRKITYSVGKDGGEKPSEVLKLFRTAYYPRIAVTVDMIATGTDVKAIECLLFMRDVKSRSYFEQMKGRGTRTMSEDALKEVTPSAVGNKTHFVLVDAVGVSKTLKTDSRPLEREPGVSLKNLLWNVAVSGDTSEDTLTSLANRLTRLEKQITPAEREQLRTLAGGKTINRVVNELLDAYNPDKIEELAKAKQESPDVPIIPALLDEVREELIREATAVFDNAEYRTLVESIRRNHEQVIDGVNLDTVTFAGWDASMTDKAETLVQDFKTYLYEHRDELTALQIFYNQPNRRREITAQMVQAVVTKLKTDRPTLAPFAIWKAYEVLDKVVSQPKSELVALVALIRRVLELDATLTPYDQTINRNFQQWVFRQQAGSLKFSEEQMEWLRLMKDTIARSIHLDRDDFDLSPFAEKGGLGKCWKLFGDRTFPLIDELNEYLAA